MVLARFTIEAQHSLSIGLAVKRTVNSDSLIVGFRAAELSCTLWAFYFHALTQMQGLSLQYQTDSLQIRGPV
jgi:hypothetical protein